MSGTWKGVDKPGGAKYVTPESFKHLPDCPKCKYGSLIVLKPDETMRCIDCKQEYSWAETHCGDCGKVLSTFHMDWIHNKKICHPCHLKRTQS